MLNHKYICVMWCGAFACAVETPPPAAAGGSESPAAAALPETAASATASAGSPAQPAVPATTQPPSAAAPPGLPESDTSSCPERFTVATRASVDMSWPETVGYLAGRAKLQTWSKTTHTRSASGTTSEVTMCGVSLPVITTTVLLDGVRLANEIPTAAFDLPSMPRVVGSSSLRAGKYVIETGVTALGNTLSDANVAWPTRRELPLVDHDADGKPGVTALPKNGGEYGLPPADVGQTEHADEVYIAARLAFRLTTSQAPCAARAEGEVEPLGFDYTIVGCHVQGGAECRDNQVNLLDNNDPTFEIGAGGQWLSLPIDESASCAAVLAALPAE
jgi:hypothetical protein